MWASKLQTVQIPSAEVNRPSKTEEEKKRDGAAQLSLRVIFLKDLRMCGCDGEMEKRNRKGESRKGHTLRESEDKREDGAEPPLNFYSFVRCA